MTLLGVLSVAVFTIGAMLLIAVFGGLGNPTSLNLALGAAAVVGLVIREIFRAPIKTNDTFVGGAVGFCVGWIGIAILMAKLDPKFAGLGGEGEALAWTPLALAFGGVIPVIVLIIGAFVRVIVRQSSTSN